ncbi:MULTISPECIES: S8 family serine peptidase [unclassified Streptomyces]|uniref:S8 family serine peptidase n=1 Tax=unclassified Streptomyces TaxID=2593676 RepID=UPI002E19C3A8|nr:MULTISPECIES: S8 family serine peptidase [unclassified Streptomyces]
MSFTRALRAVGAAAAAGALLFAAAPTALADQVRDDQWALTAFAADKVWGVATGKGVTVAVIDSGFKTDHPDLTGQFLKGKDFVDGDASVEPDMGGDKPEHGTAMASVIAGHGHGAGNASGVKGLAPDAKILPIRDYGNSGVGFYGSSIRYAVDHGADVINISQGIGSAGDSAKDVLAENEAIKYALDHGVPVVTASGNDGEKVADSRDRYPSVEPGAVTVGAVDSQGAIWDKSNYGPEVMLAAPGVKNVVAGLDSDGYDRGTGTSSSTAYTSATLALLKQKFPDLSAGQLVNRLTNTAALPDSAKGLSLPDERYGYGFIRPYSALTEDVPAGSKIGPLKADELNASIAKAKGSDASAPSSSSTGAASDSSDSSGISTGVIVGIAAGVLVVLVVVVIVIVRSRKNNGGGPPPPPGGGWGGGGQQPYPVQQAYPGSYPQQAPPAPGSYPQQAPQAPPAPPVSYPQASSQHPYRQQ